MSPLSPGRLLNGLRGAYRKFVCFEIHYLNLKHHNPRDKADVINLKHSYEIFDPARTSRLRRMETMVLDLRLSEEEIYSRFNKTTKYEIRRAIKEGVFYSVSQEPCADEIRSFLAAYRDLKLRANVFVRPLNHYLYFSDRGELCITRSADNTGRPLSYHVYIKRDSVALLINSVTIMSDEQGSIDKNLAGRANRLNHWEDVKILKTLGVDRLDLGGWFEDDKDDKKFRSINEFKSGFGADVIYCYHQLIPYSIAGKIVINFRRAQP